MPFVHGKDTVITIDGKDLSAYANTSELGRSGEVHNVTTYGSANYPDGRKPNVYNPGNVDSKGNVSGVYDSTAVSGPRAVLKALTGKKVALIRKPEGTGTGRPQETVDIIVTDYTETNPVADMVTWKCEFQGSGVIAEITQP